MAVQVHKDEIASGHPGLDKINKTVTIEATILISGLKSKFGLLIGGVGTIKSFERCRLDRQPPPSRGINLQIQLNDLQGDSSIATCIVSSSVIDSIATWPSGLRQHQEGWLTRRIRIALTQSLNDGHIYRISGSFYDTDNPPNLTPREGDSYKHRRSDHVEIDF